ncbi:DUF370 domain-containing protein [Dehalobacter sp. DCM]|uniref:extracellular matrix regulator RemB n=1 Tax=Dehalobacter sp. DCM TaxID=2907827 RepID=UPI003081B231|nr:DUF370 domain-containing protein [Dehalobacter sp. DCM]
MFLHIGNNYMVRKDKIVLILDLNTAGSNPAAKKLLNNVLKKGKVHTIAEEGKQNTCIITDNACYISPISSGTLLKRSLNESEF